MQGNKLKQNVINYIRSLVMSKHTYPELKVNMDSNKWFKSSAT
jgi:hypothetical protein